MFTPKKTLTAQLWDSLRKPLLFLLLILMGGLAIFTLLLGYPVDIKSLGLLIVPYLIGAFILFFLVTGFVLLVCWVTITVVCDYVNAQDIRRYLPFEKSELEEKGIVTPSDFAYFYFAFMALPYKHYFIKNKLFTIKDDSIGINSGSFFDEISFYYEHFGAISNDYNLTDENGIALAYAHHIGINGEIGKVMSELLNGASSLVQDMCDDILASKSLKLQKNAMQGKQQWTLQYVPNKHPSK